jgi:hypothetical protein
VDRPQRLARKSEERAAERHGGRVTPMSGSGRVTKNDVTNGTWSYEVKSTSQKGYRLTHADLLKAERGAQQDGKRMAFLIEFVGGVRAAFPRPGRYIVTSEDDFIEREQELAEVREQLRICQQFIHQLREHKVID